MRCNLLEFAIRDAVLLPLCIPNSPITTYHSPSEIPRSPKKNHRFAKKVLPILRKLAKNRPKPEIISIEPPLFTISCMKTPTTRLSKCVLGSLALGGLVSLAQAEVMNEIRFYSNSGGGATGVVPNNVTTGPVGGPFTTGATGLPASGAGTPAGLTRTVGSGASGTDTYTMTASGSDYWGAEDRGAFAFDNAAAGQSGDFSAIVRSVSVAADPAEYLGPNGPHRH